MDIIKSMAVKNLCYITGKKMTPQGIIVHSTGANNPYLKRYVDCPSEVGVNEYDNHWNTAKPDGRSVCVHAFIGYDKNNKVRIAEILPLDICAWGVGWGINGSYNYSPAYIQFEICEDDLTGKTYYRKAFDLAVKYCVMLCKMYGIPVDNIKSHREAHIEGYGSNHGDPEHWMKKFGETMYDFRKKVSKSLNSSEKDDAKTFSSCEIQRGMLVSLTPDAVYYNNKKVPEWVKAQNWYVKDIPIGDRAVIDDNESRNLSICSAINIKYLKAVKK